MKSRSRKILLILGSILGGFTLCALLCCGGMNFFFGMMADNVRLKLENDPQFAAHVGQIQEINHDFFAGIDLGEEVEVYDVKGTKWSGRLTLKHENQFDTDGKILWVRFTLPSGEVIKIEPGRNLVSPPAPNPDGPRESN
jgi:hypothetical protein